MGYKQKAFAGEKVDLADGYWVRVRPLSGDQSITLGETVKTDGTTGTRESVVYLLTNAIAEWNLDDDDGQPLPIDETSVGDLTAQDQMAIVNVAKRLNQLSTSARSS